MRRIVVLCLAFFPIGVLAQGAAAPPPAARQAPPTPTGPAFSGLGAPEQPFGAAAGQRTSEAAAPAASQAAGLGAQGYGGCYGCSYSGEYSGSNAGARRPAPPLRLQGQWRNGWWYY